jgi:predicted DNA-binding transcriptional regulator AlpA
MTSVSKTAIKKPAAQVAASKKAAAIKAAAKRPQPSWLRDLKRQLPPLSDESEKTKRPPAVQVTAARAKSATPGVVRLLDKHDVCAIAGATYPTIWVWMRAGTFPRSRIVGGKSMWLSSEIDGWLAGLPLRPLKPSRSAASKSASVTR